MKNIIKVIIYITILILVYTYKNEIVTFISDEIIYRGSDKIFTYNEYYKENDFFFVQNIDTSEVNNYQELLNMVYSIINSGDNAYTFKCNYDKCIDDLQKIYGSDNDTIGNILTNIDYFVHPYNSLNSIIVENTAGKKVTIKLKRRYDEKKIKYINDFINNFINENITNEMSIQEKLKIFHDYIIDSTSYDDNKELVSAYDLLKNNKATCNGYTDIMAIYLSVLNIENIRIASKTHVWNLVNIENKWYHIDLTWDDPRVDDGSEYILDNFFLISTEELLKLDNIEHNFDKDIFMEAIK